MSTSFTTLPAEILSKIVANVGSGRTLCNLARCSCQLYHCTTPHLYRRITIPEETEVENRQLIRLASLLIRRPDLAGHVRHFRLGTVKEGLPLTGEFIQPELAKFDQAFGSVTNASSLSVEEKFLCLEQFSPSRNCPYDLILARLLPELVKVETVLLSWSSILDTSHLERMMQRAARREKPFDDAPPFQALKSFTFSHCISDSPCAARSANFIAWLLRLPAIQAISGGFESTWVTATDKNLMELKSSSSPLVYLNLSASKLSAVDLIHLLRAPKALKHFIYNICPPTGINLADIRQALEPQRGNLQKFDLDDIMCEIPLYGPMPSYISFTALRFLKATALFFLTVDLKIERHMLPQILPPYLQTLHLTRFHASFMSLLEALQHLIIHKSPQQSVLLDYIILDEEVAEDPREDPGMIAEGPKLMEVLWEYSQEKAILRLQRLGLTQGVFLHVMEDP